MPSSTAALLRIRFDKHRFCTQHVSAARIRALSATFAPPATNAIHACSIKHVAESAHRCADCCGRHPADDDDQGRRARARRGAGRAVQRRGDDAAALEAECLAAPAPAPAPAPAAGELRVGLAAKILSAAQQTLPDSLTDTQRAQVKAALANALVDFIDVDLAHQLADATPGMRSCAGRL